MTDERQSHSCVIPRVQVVPYDQALLAEPVG